jgi:hypothetical protein
MSVQFLKSIRTWLWLVLVICCLTVSASAVPNAISKVGSVSKTVVQKAFDGTKSVAKGSASGERCRHHRMGSTDSLVSRVRSARSEASPTRLLQPANRH